MYRLAEDGLTVETRARNFGEAPCPYACGQHPYLPPGPGVRVDDCTLELKAATAIVTDPERQVPVGTKRIEETDYDFRSACQIGGREIDQAFTELARDDERRAWIRLACPDGQTVELWSDQAYPVSQIYTGDTLAPERRRTGLAAEPMTAPANALAGPHACRHLHTGPPDRPDDVRRTGDSGHCGCGTMRM